MESFTGMKVAINANVDQLAGSRQKFATQPVKIVSHSICNMILTTILQNSSSPRCFQWIISNPVHTVWTFPAALRLAKLLISATWGHKLLSVYPVYEDIGHCLSIGA